MMSAVISFDECIQITYAFRLFRLRILSESVIKGQRLSIRGDFMRIRILIPVSLYGLFL